MDDLKGKDPSLIVHTNHPPNAEPELTPLRENFVTPYSQFYIRSHGETPHVDAETFQLKVGGLTEHQLSYSLSELKNDYEKYTVMATLQCAGNRRNQLMAVSPIPGEVPWQSGAIGNAEWSGVRLKDVLTRAGVLPQATFVEFLGADDVIRHDENVGFGASIPLAKGQSEEVLLAYEMNGAPLEPTHGSPLRAVVPGYIGARSVKWLTRINLLDHPSKSYFQDKGYRLYPPDAKADNVDVYSGIPLGELMVNSVITSLHDGDHLKAGKQRMQGYAMSGGDRTITRVEVSVDGGHSWTEARITEGASKWVWSFWEAEVNVQAGAQEMIVRAFDSAGNAQPERTETVWNFKGYMNNAWHRVKVTVA